MELKRHLFHDLKSDLSKREISILIGARQVGKSTLLHQLDKVFHEQSLSTKFYNLELSADLEQLAGDEKTVFEKLTGGPDVVFLDEFHYLKNAFKIFKAIYDSKCRVKIFASGSSSVEMHKHLRESLAGRFRRTIIYPLSFSECRQIPNFDLQEYLRWGGMPGLIHCNAAEEKAALLENIVSTYLTKDIKGLIQEENVRAFNSLLYLLAQNQGSLGVISSLARETGMSEPTVTRHLEIMSQTYVCHTVTSFSQNMANELKKSKKYYLFDLGIRNCLLKDFGLPAQRKDQGTLLESFVLLHLLQQLKPNMEIRFWRTKKGEEVDFILLKNRVPVPVEVKSGLNEMTVPSGLRLFLKNYKTAPFGIVFSNDFVGETAIEGRPVFFKKIEGAVHLEYLQKII